MEKLKILLFIIFSFITFMQCQKDKLPDLTDSKPVTCNTSDEAIEWFEDDAYALTIRNIFEDSASIFHSYKDSINLPIELYDDILTNLGAIYDNYNGLELDSVIDYNAHAFPNYVRGELIFWVVNETDWVQEFINGEEITSNELVKEQFEKYDIQFKSIILVINATVRIRVTVDLFLNLEALSLKLLSLGFEGNYGISTEGLGFIGFSPPDITIDVSSDTTQIDFSSADERFHWKFKVDENCIPYFVGN